VILAFDEYALDRDRRELRCGDAAISLEPKVFDLLAYLLEHRDRVVSRDELIASVWDGRIVSESALASCINAARAAIADDGD
jgi:DNA-binding winged helix-turn-helix (wHTH) protein